MHVRGFSSQRITLLIHFLSVCVCVGVDGWVWGGGVKSKKHMLGLGGESRGDIVRAGVVR